MNQIVIAVVLLSCYLGLIYGYTDCGGTAGSLISVEISGCSSSAKRCQLKRKTNVTIEINFKSNVDSDAINAVVHGVIMDVPVPFALPNSNGCVDSGITCPVKAGETYKYVAEMPISSKYPRVTVDVKWELQFDNTTDFACVLIPSKIV